MSSSVSVPIPPEYGFYALGGVCFGLGVFHFLTEGESVGTALESVMIVGLSTIPFHTAYRLPDRPISAAGKRRAVGLSLGISGAFALLAFAVWLVWYVEGRQAELTFLLALAAALGAAVGSRSSLYAVQSEEQLTQAQELTKLLRMNQRILRHNLRNELTIALGHLENIERSDDPERTAESVRVIRKHLNALTETSDRSRRIVTIWETDATRKFDLPALIEERVASLQATQPDVSVETDLPDGCVVTAHPELPVAIEEALENAVEHNTADVTVFVSVRQEGETAVLKVADTGCGIPEADRAAIELAGETALTHAQGLGLWTIYWVVRKSGGTVELDERDSGGAVIRITLPAASASAFPF